MPLPSAFLAQQTSNTSGTGTLNLVLADARFRSFLTAVGGAARIVYRISRSGTTEWEIGIGAYDGGTPGTLTRSTVIANHLGTTALVSFGSGTKDVQLLSLPNQQRQTDFSSTTTAALADLGGLLRFTGSASCTLNLPAVATVPVNTGYTIVNQGTLGAVVTIDPSGSETINGVLGQFVFANEACEIRSTGSSWICMGLASMALVSTGTIATSVVDIALPGSGSLGPERFVLELDHVDIQTDNQQILLRTSSDGGSSYASGASDYLRSAIFNSGASSVNSGAAASSSIIIGSNMDNASLLCGRYDIWAGGGSGPERFQLQGMAYAPESTGALLEGGMVAGKRQDDARVTNIRLLASSGDLVSGTWRVYAIRT
ncbi:hypothetical protein [Falsiroseomonas tokyonensis]|uniref:Uncharacterized protein n=1 Tax=Falsiroseomonas tokyonensis TaxID=430521 RepID=A0ABV7BYU8_9PROT|nr:hypothetical protein [Falsiroseomonas tokyonensis]MBU8540805.1 hypothetical protein [Falsiroseomonas tokyonensis]